MALSTPAVVATAAVTGALVFGGVSIASAQEDSTTTTTPDDSSGSDDTQTTPDRANCPEKDAAAQESAATTS